MGLCKKMKTFTLHRAMPRELIISNVLKTLNELSLAKAWRVTIDEFKKPRSLDQNAYLWGVVYKILHDVTGQEPDDWHEYFLGQYHGWEEVEFFGRKKLKPRNRSSKMSASEFIDYWTFIQAKCAENGISIPDPDSSLKRVA
jgi:hypothetical protein